jgi:hypothetical protein
MKGEKFTEKYGGKSKSLSTANIYKGNPESLKIPPKDHVLYDATAPTTFDPIRVEVIDKDGKMTTPIEVWSDPDTKTLWILDGRGRFLDVQEVNRRRKESKRELVEPYIVPFNGDEKAAIARVRQKNYHRREMTSSGMAVDLAALRKAGYSWEQCAEILHVETQDATQWGTKLAPLAHCIPEVREAIDSGELSKGVARKFGGGKVDGSKALGKKEQLDLLEALRKEKDKPKTASKAPSAGTRDRVYTALSNGASADLKGIEKEFGKGFAAALAWVSGDKKALEICSKVGDIVREAAKKPEKKVKDKEEKAE